MGYRSSHGLRLLIVHIEDDFTQHFSLFAGVMRQDVEVVFFIHPKFLDLGAF